MEERRAKGERSGGGKAAGRKGGIKMKEGMQRPVALQTEVRKQNTVMYGEERNSKKGIKRERQNETQLV